MCPGHMWLEAITFVHHVKLNDHFKNSSMESFNINLIKFSYCIIENQLRTVESATIETETIDQQ